MIKSALLATAISFAFVVPAFAQQTVKCDEASLTEMRKNIEAAVEEVESALEANSQRVGSP